MFRSISSTADVLTAILHRIRETIDNSVVIKAIGIDISQALDKVWQRSLI